jgi:DNA-binding transcriptional LysR family regulator
MDRLLSIEAFVTVANAKSFAGAARQMRVSNSVVSTRVRQLEAYVGGALFHRNTRSLLLSELGAAFLSECSDIAMRADRLVDQMRDVRGSVSGRLKVHALPGFVFGHLAEHLRDFQDRHPSIGLDLIVSDDVIDPIRDGIDCALQIFNPASDELIGRKVFQVRRVLCASPGYLAKHGQPQIPADLCAHRLGLYSGYPTRDRWAFARDGEEIRMDLEPVLRTNSVHLLKEYAMEHAGIVCVPTVVAVDALLSGELVPVLSEWSLSSFWLSVVYARSHRGGAKLRLFIDSLLARYSDEPPWDSQLLARGIIRAVDGQRIE